MNRTVHITPGLPLKARRRLLVSGVVQGIGFRPFVYRLAHALKITGWIENTPLGGTIEIEGPAPTLKDFQTQLLAQAPGTANIQDISIVTIPIQGDTEFSIRASRLHGTKRSVIPPDFATCADCLAEISDPSARRYRYPFTTCTQCGPRYSIAEAIPFDRNHTTMKKFPLCDECRHEYEEMSDRRFHAEAIACQRCGPQVALWDSTGIVVAERETAITKSCGIIRKGNILAVKGLGGFQLWADAQSEEAVQRLRNRKHRPRKPFAVLFPTLAMLKEHCEVLKEEERLLTSHEAPIVLLRRHDQSCLAPSLAPDNPYLGAMLPCTPLHHLLTENLHTPVVATSGNRSEEPIVTDEYDALMRLKGIADAYLVHDRPIARPVDDSVVRIVSGDLMVLRRARGYTPAPVPIKVPATNRMYLPSVLAVGGHLKNTVGVTTHDQVIVSQHIGDLSTPEAHAQFQRTIADQLRLFDIKPHAIACDLHPDYPSTIYAKTLGKEMSIPVTPVQHHYAHILSCMAEHGLEGPVLGIAWDGAGYGTDGTMWGGEFLLADYSGFRRVGHLKPFRLPGGEPCMREPRRVALSLLYEMFGDECLKMDFPPIRSLGRDLAASLVELLKKNVNCPKTTSIGRLFDGISSILGLCHLNTFEGEAAMALEFKAEGSLKNGGDERYAMPVIVTASGEKGQEEEVVSGPIPFLIDWKPLINAIIRDVQEGKISNEIAQRFHQGLAILIVRVAEKHHNKNIILTGGVFQNILLLKHALNQLQKASYKGFTNHLIPPNDGGLPYGQAILPVR